MTATFIKHAEATTAPDPVVASRRAAMEFLLRMGGEWGHEDAHPLREPYRTFQWTRACLLAGTPVWVLVLGWQDFDEDPSPGEEQPGPDAAPWLFMIELWDTDPSVPDYDVAGKMLHQFQTREFDLVAHTVQAILDHADDARM